MKRNGISRVVRASALGIALSLGAAAVPVGAGASEIISASPSQFCSTLLSFHPKAPTNSMNWTGYRVWAKSVLPTFEKLAATAPNAGTKELMNQLVALLKFDASAKNLQGYATYWRTHITHWEHDWQQFALADISCVK